MTASFTYHGVNAKWRAAFAILLLVLFIFLAHPVEHLQPRFSQLNKTHLLDSSSGFLDNVGKYLPSIEWRPINGTQHSTGIWPGAKADVEEDVAICCATRDQHEDLKEWLSHHYHHLGIRRFYIMDDASSPELSTFDDWPIPHTTMSFHYFTRDSFPGKDQQTEIYHTCSRLFGNSHKWIGFIDADEFLEIVEQPGKSMAEFLKQYVQYGALGISWAIHNSNGLLTRPNSVRKDFTSCIYDGKDAFTHTRHVKSFAQTKYNVGSESPHNFYLNESKIQVGEHGDEFSYAWRQPNTRDRVALHHYAVKSKQEMKEKIEKWPGPGGRKWEFCEYFECLPPASSAPD